MRSSSRKEIDRLAEILRVELLDRKQAEADMEQTKKTSLQSYHSSRASTPMSSSGLKDKANMGLTVSVGGDLSKINTSTSVSGFSSPSNRERMSPSGRASPKDKLGVSDSSPKKKKEKLNVSASSPSKDRLSTHGPPRVGPSTSKEVNILTVHADSGVSV